MRTMISAASVAALLGFGGLSLAGIAPASADSIRGAQDQAIADYCNTQMNAETCSDWRDHRDQWSPEEYRGFYEKHRNESGLNTADAAAAFAQPGTYEQGSSQPVYLQPGSTQPGYVVVQSPPVVGQPVYLQPGSTQPGYVIVQNAPVSSQPVYVVVPSQPVAGRADNEPFVIGQQRGNVEGNQPEIIGDSNTHVADCIATFKSYNVSTDSYMAFDGSVHRCKL